MELNFIINTITSMYVVMAIPENIALAKADPHEFRLYMIDQFQDFYDQYYTLFTIVVDDFDGTKFPMLFEMIKRAEDVQGGKISIDDANAQVSEKLSHKYIYSKFGGKDKFEETIRKRGNK